MINTFYTDISLSIELSFQVLEALRNAAFKPAEMRSPWSGQSMTIERTKCAVKDNVI